MQRKDEFNFFKVPSSLEPFISASKKIEEDWNYKPNIMNQELMSLVRNETSVWRFLSCVLGHPSQLNAIKIRQDF